MVILSILAIVIFVKMIHLYELKIKRGFVINIVLILSHKTSLCLL